MSLTFEEGQSLYNGHFDTIFEEQIRDKKRKAKLTTEQSILLQQLESKIDEQLKIHFPNGSAFIKLNTRSPKDSPYRMETNESIRVLVKNELQLLKQDFITASQHTQSNNSVQNLVAIAFTKAMNKAMKIQNGKQALQLLLNSERMSTDISKNLSFGEDHFHSKLIIREWDDNIVENPQLEFRCFVHEGKLNAVTQYFSDTYFSPILKNKQQIEERIKTFFNQTAAHIIPHPSYVLDLFVLDEDIKIIEINPFHIGAGAGKFSWAKDRQILMHGPLEFRYNEILPQTDDHYQLIFSVQWERYVKQQLELLLQVSPEKDSNSKCIIC